MTPGEATAALGVPLIKNHGRGFDVMVYDSGAEVVCFLGTVVAWTGPEGSRTLEGRNIDLSGIKPVAISINEKASAKSDAVDFGYEQIKPRVFRLPIFR